MQSRKGLSFLVFAAFGLWPAFVYSIDMNVYDQFECIASPLTDSQKEGWAPGPCSITGDSSTTTNVATLVASGGFDCDNIGVRLDPLIAPKKCEDNILNISAGPECSGSLPNAATRYSNAARKFRWQTTSPDVRIQPFPNWEYGSNWKDDSKIYAIWMGQQSGSASLTVGRLACAHDPQPLEPDPPSSAPFTVSFMPPPNPQPRPFTVGKTWNYIGFPAFIFYAASEGVQKDEDGPGRSCDMNCDGIIDANCGENNCGKYDKNVPRRYEISGSIITYDASKDVVYAPPRQGHSEDSWYQTASENAIFCVSILVDKDGDGQYTTTAAGLQPPSHIVLAGSAGGGVMVHEIGHLDGLSHIDRTTCYPGEKSNVMWYSTDSSGSSTSVWIAEVSVHIETNGDPPIPDGLESQTGF